MWDVPGPGHEPVSPALAGGFLTTVPPGKPQNFILLLVSSDLSAFLVQSDLNPMLIEH